MHRRGALSRQFSPLPYLSVLLCLLMTDGFPYQGRVRAYPSQAEHRLLSWQLEIQGRNAAQMWSLGGKNGPIPGQEVRASFSTAISPLLRPQICIAIESVHVGKIFECDTSHLRSDD